MIKEAKSLVKEINQKLPKVALYNGVSEKADELLDALERTEFKLDTKTNKININCSSLNDLNDSIGCLTETIENQSQALIDSIEKLTNNLSREISYLTDNIRNK